MRRSKPTTTLTVDFLVGGQKAGHASRDIELATVPWVTARCTPSDGRPDVDVRVTFDPPLVGGSKLARIIAVLRGR